MKHVVLVFVFQVVEGVNNTGQRSDGVDGNPKRSCHFGVIENVDGTENTLKERLQLKLTISFVSCVRDTASSCQPCSPLLPLITIFGQAKILVSWKATA